MYAGVFGVGVYVWVWVGVFVEGRREGGAGGWGCWGSRGGGGAVGAGGGLVICFSALNVLSADTLEHILTSLLHILLISYKAEMYMLIVCLLFIKWILTSLFVQE